MQDPLSHAARTRQQLECYLSSDTQTVHKSPGHWGPQPFQDSREDIAVHRRGLGAGRGLEPRDLEAARPRAAGSLKLRGPGGRLLFSLTFLFVHLGGVLEAGGIVGC